MAARRAAARGGDRAALQEQEARKLSREARLREIRGGDGAGGYHSGGIAGAPRGGAGATTVVQYPEDEQHAVREKLLGDIDAARRRAKRAAVLKKLRAGLASRRTVRPAYGELCFFEHEFKSPVSRDCVFEVRCDDPDLMSWRRRMSGRGFAPPRECPRSARDGGRRTAGAVVLLGQESVKVPSFQFDAEPAGTGARRPVPRARRTGAYTSAALSPCAVQPRTDRPPGCYTSALVACRPWRERFGSRGSEHDFFKARLPRLGIPARDADGNSCLAVRSDPAVAVAEPSLRGSSAGVEGGSGSGGGAEEITPISTARPKVPLDVFTCACAPIDISDGWRHLARLRTRHAACRRLGARGSDDAHEHRRTGGNATRRVAAFSSHPDELGVARIVAPPAGAPRRYSRRSSAGARSSGRYDSSRGHRAPRTGALRPRRRTLGHRP